MEVDEPRRRAANPDNPAEVAKEPPEAVREAADEPRRVLGDPLLLLAPADDLGPVPTDPDLPQPGQEEADEPRKRP
jgi:hypothetical protein